MSYTINQSNSPERFQQPLDPVQLRTAHLSLASRAAGALVTHSVPSEAPAMVNETAPPIHPPVNTATTEYEFTPAIIPASAMTELEALRARVGEQARPKGDINVPEAA